MYFCQSFKIALGLFVTTSNLPFRAVDENIILENISYNCTFDTPCPWFSDGSTVDHWRLARGQPDSFLWLASTGSIQKPEEPFALIELRGKKADTLLSDKIPCEDGTSTLSFTYWIVGGANIKVCLVDLQGKNFNCTAMIGERSMPKKVSVPLPKVDSYFRVIFTIPRKLQLLQSFATSESTNFLQVTKNEITVTDECTETTTHTSFKSTSLVFYNVHWSLSPNSKSTEPSFDLVIIGNKTTPLFDQRRGRIIANGTNLFCDFTNDFPCLWGPESGRWGIIHEGALPSLSTNDSQSAPSYPAAIVIQGTAMLTSDPLKCQTGPGKLMFRYWTNGLPKIQICAIGYSFGSEIVECVSKTTEDIESVNDQSLLVFDIKKPILEPFTINIIPKWHDSARNQYLIIDEIIYLGNCDINKLSKEIHEKSNSTVRVKPKSYGNFIWPIEMHKLEVDEKKMHVSPSATALISESKWTTTITPKKAASQSLTSNYFDNACNYLNHGLTKVPWMLRNGVFRTSILDFANIPTNGKFISTILSPGQYAILESPLFQATSEASTLLLKYYRSSLYATIRLCVDSNHTKFYKKVSDFLQCPSILQKQISKNTHKWSSTYTRLPAGTTRFYLVAHNSNRSVINSVIAIHHIKLATCNAENDATVKTSIHQNLPSSFQYSNSIYQR
ncbi:unnamed protein product [Thelazia callipaeda]|uniref:MAM domain-containing protein n=1 Tax=Thelazia callipaeda TaxID=103827 RepID=A0A3P7KDH3_THECL|nr:unnamed protein product [Thelazia callipaeda]